jgi:glycine cleavage system H protein
MKFTETHEWIAINNGIGTVGVTDHAQRELGDIVYVELPKVGKQVKKGEEAAVLESTKAAADVYSPASGTIVEVNKSLNETSELVNKSPEDKGWLFKLQIKDADELNDLMEKDVYLGTVR